MGTILYSEQPPTLEEFNGLRRDAGWGVFQDLGALEQGLRNSLYHVCARHNGWIVGMGRVVGDGSITFYIQDVIVAQEYRDQGIGREIMHYLMRFVAQNATAGAIVGLMAAKGKEGFYEKFGFIGRPNEHFGKGMFMFWPKEKVEHDNS